MRPKSIMFVFVSTVIAAGCYAGESPVAVPPSVEAVTATAPHQGNYHVTWGDRVSLTLRASGGVWHAEAAPGGRAEFRAGAAGPVVVDLAALCARPEVRCPWRSIAHAAAVTEAPMALWLPGVYNARLADNDPATCPRSFTGLTNARGQFWFGLGGASGGNGTCGLAAWSYADGRFTRDDAGAVSGLGGRVVFTVLGACLSNPILLGATLDIEVPFRGVRSGPYAPAPGCR